MAKRVNNSVSVVTEKQRVSKILSGQVLSHLEWNIEFHQDIKCSAAYKLLNSSATSKYKIDTWFCDDFHFRFEYGKRHGSVRVSYVNSDGLQSAVFSASEWEALTSYLKNKVRLMKERAEAKDKAEEEARKKAQFQAAVKEAVDRALKEKEQEELQKADERFKKYVGNLQDLPVLPE